jgi:hypothetical protein
LQQTEAALHWSQTPMQGGTCCSLVAGSEVKPEARLTGSGWLSFHLVIHIGDAATFNSQSNFQDRIGSRRQRHQYVKSLQLRVARLGLSGRD